VGGPERFATLAAHLRGSVVRDGRNGTEPKEIN